MLSLVIFLHFSISSVRGAGQKVTCDCGFVQDTGDVWSSVFYTDWTTYSKDIRKDQVFSVAQYTIAAKYNGTLDRVFSHENVWTSPEGLNLQVTSQPTGGSVSTKRKDILYGSFRATMKTTMIAGTVASFYFYYDDNAEFDVELLSYQKNPSTVYWAIHPDIKLANGGSSNLTHAVTPLNFDPTAAFHEYRMDWVPGQVTFYVDSIMQARFVTNIPSVPGAIIFNHWTDGDPNFGYGPPMSNAILQVANTTFFFNTSSDNQLACKGSSTPCNVSDIESGILKPTSSFSAAIPPPRPEYLLSTLAASLVVLLNAVLLPVVFNEAEFPPRSAGLHPKSSASSSDENKTDDKAASKSEWQSALDTLQAWNNLLQKLKDSKVASSTSIPSIKLPDFDMKAFTDLLTPEKLSKLRNLPDVLKQLSDNIRISEKFNFPEHMRDINLPSWTSTDWKSQFSALREQWEAVWRLITLESNKQIMAQIVQDCTNPEINPECAQTAHSHDQSIHRYARTLCDEENEFVKKRRRTIRSSFARYIGVDEDEVHEDDIPIIGVAGSGGGYRSMIAGLGYLQGMERHGLYDCVMYNTAVSGSCWLLCLLHSPIANSDMSAARKHLKNSLGNSIVDITRLYTMARSSDENHYTALHGLVQRGRWAGEITLVDIFGTVLGSVLLSQSSYKALPGTVSQESIHSDGNISSDSTPNFLPVDDLKLSKQQRYVADASRPLPIYCAVRHEIPKVVGENGLTSNKWNNWKPWSRDEIALEDAKAAKRAEETLIEKAPESEADVQGSTRDTKAYFQWFEITPFEMGTEEIDAWIPTWSFGRDFKEGVSLNNLSEQNLMVMMGMMGSAFAATLAHYYREIKDVIPDTALKAADGIFNNYETTLSSTHLLSPASWPNPFYEGKMQHPIGTTIKESPRLYLMDAGMDNNIPFYPLLRPSREVDVVIAVDCSADIWQTRHIDRADGYVKRRGIKGWPADKDTQESIIKSRQDIKPFTIYEARQELADEGDPRVSLIYLPLISNSNAKPDSTFDPHNTPWCSTWNFSYTPEQIDQLANLGENFDPRSKYMQMQSDPKYARQSGQQPYFHNSPMDSPQHLQPQPNTHYPDNLQQQSVTAHQFPQPRVLEYSPQYGPEGTAFTMVLQFHQPDKHLKLGFGSLIVDTKQLSGPGYTTLTASVPPFGQTKWHLSKVPLYLLVLENDIVVNSWWFGEYTYVDGSYDDKMNRKRDAGVAGSDTSPSDMYNAAMQAQSVKRPHSALGVGGAVEAAQLGAKREGDLSGAYAAYGGMYANPYSRYGMGHFGIDEQTRAQMMSSGAYGYRPSQQVYGYPVSAISPGSSSMHMQFSGIGGDMSSMGGQGQEYMAGGTAGHPYLQSDTSSPSVANYNPYASLLNKANLKIAGNMEDMSVNWTAEEWDNRRRLVQFWRRQEGNDIHCTFAPVAPAERVPNSIVVSCIYWQEKNDCYITSVDCIYLLESLIGVRFTVEEKNRIRRNLEGFRPQTVSKCKPDSAEFFKLIMSFPNPKPRNIEKDVKVFPWKVLPYALKKIISKYTASYSSTASVNVDAFSASTGYTPAHSGYVMDPAVSGSSAVPTPATGSSMDSGMEARLSRTPSPHHIGSSQQPLKSRSPSPNLLGSQNTNLGATSASYDTHLSSYHSPLHRTPSPSHSSAHSHHSASPTNSHGPDASNLAANATGITLNVSENDFASATDLSSTSQNIHYEAIHLNHGLTEGEVKPENVGHLSSDQHLSPGALLGVEDSSEQATSNSSRQGEHKSPQEDIPDYTNMVYPYESTELKHETTSHELSSTNLMDDPSLDLSEGDHFLQHEGEGER
ncbi:hypothetical protein BZG36_03696 [Bifiguratus adelaidae]|uniref:Lysophospholipase n=1 Tax=Bifiguratus adelaidae TaxID=1938954 RepID=A0A261XZ39_9FUNG|nr:hypothetical protein BZG36_03696 [Bifiguratus adelaidae]